MELKIIIINLLENICYKKCIDLGLCWFYDNIVICNVIELGFLEWLK